MCVKQLRQALLKRNLAILARLHGHYPESGYILPQIALTRHLASTAQTPAQQQAMLRKLKDLERYHKLLKEQEQLG
jgi:hypothetical protein